MNRKLWLLLIIHLIAGIGFCVCADAANHDPSALGEILILSTVALFYCQSSLLAFWVTMSHVELANRLAGLFTWLPCTFLLIGTSSQSILFSFELVLATVGLTVILFLIRCWKFELRRITDESTDEYSGGIRFSIRGLKLPALGVALLVASAKCLREIGPGPFFDLPASTSCLVVMGLASLWATMGLRPPFARSTVVTFMSLFLGWLVTYAAGTTDRFAYLLLISIMFLQTLFLLGSLLVIRSCGYRLVKRDRNAVAAVSS